jgi:CheY-like chemotaxis protein/signal transduction histidine kinase
MRKLLSLVYAAFFIIMIINFLYYSNLYKKQINYIEELLNRQVQLTGLSVDNTNSTFLSDLSQISTSSDITKFFSEPQSQYRTTERIKLFFSKYQDFVTGIKLFDNNRNEFTLKKDELSNDWLEQPFKLNVQGEIFDTEKLVQHNRLFDYYVPVMKDSVATGNFAVTVDFQRYFSEMFSAFNLKDYQWQWVVSSTGEIIYNNYEGNLQYTKVDKIVEKLAGGSIDNIVHEANINGKLKEIISSYYPAHFIQRDMGLVFSAPTDFFQKYIIRNSVIIVMSTLFIVQLIILLFGHYLKNQRLNIKKLGSSEELLLKLIDDSPSGIIIRGKGSEVIKANKTAADLYSFSNKDEMKGKQLKESLAQNSYNYFAKNMGNAVDSSRFVILKKGKEELVLYRHSIPVVFMGEEADMEILTDVTLLETARKNEAAANEAKSEFLARMSYEIRTPLNDIIGMTEVLENQKLTNEAKNILNHLRRSTEVLLSITRDILDFGKLEAGKINLAEVAFDLRKEVDFCISHVKTLINEDTLRLTASVSDKIPGSLIGDPFRLRQILINLINHSVRNTEKGSIELKCDLRSKEEGKVILGFELLDTGNCFDNSVFNDISGPLKNAEPPAGNNEISRLGLAISKRLIEMMGGDITATCPSGLSGEKGTKIKFSIVTYDSDIKIKKPDFSDITAFENIRVLVITGNQNRDEALLGQLYKLGLVVTVTTFQKSTVNQIRTNLNFPASRYSLILILNDNHFDGFEAASAIRDSGLSENFAMMMVSSGEREGNYMKCKGMGIDHYLVKPASLNDIAECLLLSFPMIEKPSKITDNSNLKTDIRILIIEDNKMNQKALGYLLKSLGYTFDLAEDGYKGYLQARTRKYDLIFMDLIMPGMDGFESARKIVEYDQSSLIVAFTADNMPDSKRKAELSGIKEFISKPVRVADLKNLLGKYFSIV